MSRASVPLKPIGPILVDMRCPACNMPARGTQDVRQEPRLPDVIECKHCRTPVRFVRSLGGLGDHHLEKRTRK